MANEPMPVTPKPNPAGKAKGSGLAIAGFVLALIGFLLGLIPFFPILLNGFGLLLSILGIKSAKKGLAIAGIIIASIGLLWNLVYASGLAKAFKETSGGTQQTQTQSKTEAKIAKIGDAARDGKFEFTVQSIQCGKTSVGTNEFLRKDAQGQYCLLNITVKNIGNVKQTLFSDNQKLLDDQNKEYSADSTATMYAAPQGSTWFNEINPGNSVSGAIVFDVPKDTKITSAELHDSAFSGGAKVNLQ